jgi:amphi-Trp domain-containing protein
MCYFDGTLQGVRQVLDETIALRYTAGTSETESRKEESMAAKAEKRLAKQKAKVAKRAMRAERRVHARKAQAILSRSQIGDQLRALASQVEAGTFVLGDKEVELPASAEFEINYKLRRKGGHQIEVEIEWGSPTDAPLLATE